MTKKQVPTCIYFWRPRPLKESEQLAQLERVNVSQQCVQGAVIGNSPTLASVPANPPRLLDVALRRPPGDPLLKQPGGHLFA